MMTTALKTIRTTVLAAALAALATGCATTGQHLPQDLPVAGEYGRGDSTANLPDDRLLDAGEYPPALEAAGPWWQRFDDARLDLLVSRVLEANRDLVSAGLRLEQARARAGLAGTDLWPQLDASANASARRELEGDADTSESFSTSVSVGYEVDLWGRLRAQRDAAVWEARATAEDLQATRLVLVGETVNLYWTLAFINQRLAAGEESLARVQRTLELVRVQYDVGAVSRIELREAEQNLLSQQAAQSDLRQQRVETRNALTVLLDGVPWPQENEPQDLAAAQSPAIEPGLPAELLGRRPDLRAAEHRLRSTLADVHATRTSYYPAISLNASIGGSSTSLADVVANPVATLGAGLALPFLRWNEMQLNTAIAEAGYEIAVNDFRTTLYTAFSEVDNALSGREQLARQVELSRESLEAAEEIERLYEVRYRAGATPLRTWLDAQETRRNAELALAQARLDLLRNDVVLFQALGGSDRS